jgi:hypothetical protein
VLTPRNIAISLAVCAGITAFAAWLFELKFERAITLAPVIVVAFGAIAGLVILWTRIALDQWRGRHGDSSRR